MTRSPSRAPVMCATPRSRLRRHLRRRLRSCAPLLDPGSAGIFVVGSAHVRHSSIPAPPASSSSAPLMCATPRSRLRRHLRRRRASRGHYHGLRRPVLINSHGSATFPAEPALVEATERCPAGTETVDRDLPGANPAGDGDRAGHVGAPHPTGKPVLGG